MLYMILVKASKLSETGIFPSKELMIQMDTYNELLDQEGVRVMAKGL